MADNISPTLSSVTASTANGTYRIGDVIAVQLNFSDAVTVTGTPQLTLETGAIDRVVSYASGSGTSTLTFNYMVQSGDTTADLDYVSTSALALNGGTIRDADGDDAILTLATPGAANSLGANRNIVIDGVAPTVSGVTSSSANGSYGVGDQLTIRVNFSEAVTVTGTPQLTLETGATDRVVSYAGGSGTSALTFTYTVQSGDTTADLDYVSTSALALNGGTIRDVAGNNALLTLASPGAANSLGANKNIIVDGVAPNVASVATPSNGAYRAGQVLSFTIAFDENVTVTGTDSVLTLNIGGQTRQAAYASKTANTIRYDYTVQAGDIDANGISLDGLSLGSSTIRDGVGNAASLSLAGHTPSLSGVLIDTTAPAAPSTPDMAAASDTGASSSDNITRNVTPTFVGTAEAGATVTLYDTDGTTVLGTGVAAGGTWSITPISSLSSGAHAVTARAVDGAGNSSAASASLEFTIDTTAPTLSLASDVATLKAGETATITFSFSEDPGASFGAGAVSVSGGSLGALSGSGLTRTAIFTPTVGVDSGSASISVAAGAYSDTAGNSGGAAATPSLTFDTLAPNAPSTPDLDAASDTGASNSDDITDVRTPTFSGTAEAGARVRLFDGATEVGTGVATGGVWSITASTLAAGSHSIVAVATDAAGNASAASAALSLVIRDNRAPTGSVTVSGAARPGETLSAANTLADADGLGAITYRWQRDGADIGGATGATYVLTDADVGAQVRVVARYTDLLGSSESVASSAMRVSSADNAGPLAVNAPATISAAAGTTVTLSGPISGASPLTVNGGGTVVLSGSGAYSGTATITGGTLSVNGSLPNATIAVGSGGTLAGTGTVGATSIGSGGVLATGNSPGVLHTANLTLATGAAFNVEIASAGSYDRADVTGTVNLGGATLNLTALGGFTPQLGHVYTIVANDGTDAVTGAFAGLAQGATVSLGGVQLTISYRGGDGNDVTLSAPALPVAPPPADGGTSSPPSLVANANRAIGFDIASAKAASPTVVDPSGKVQANPNYVTALAVQAVQADYGAGKITAVQATAKLIDLALPTKGVAIESYLFFTGGAPTSAGMTYLVNSDANHTDLTDPYYAVFNTQNRYINFAVNLGANGEGRAAFAQAYGTLSFEQAIAKAYDAVIGVGAARAAGYDTTAGMAYVNGQKGYFEALGGSDIGAKAAMVGYLLSVSSDIHLGGYYQAAAGLIGEQVGLVGGVSAL